MKPHNWVPLPDAELIARYQEDRGACAALAVQYAVNPSTIWRRLRALGVVIRKNGDAQRGLSSLEHNPNWKGGRTIRGDGYLCVKMPEHPRADRRNGYVAVHILIAERALGKPLPLGTEVHHANEIKIDNQNTNLVICQDTAYHQLLHVRLRIRKFGGNPNTDRICVNCQLPKNKQLFGKDAGRPDGLQYMCRTCVNELSRIRYEGMSLHERQQKHKRGTEVRRRNRTFWQDAV